MGPIVPGSFQVWLRLSVMSARLTGTRPNSGVHDGMGVLKQAGAGLGMGRRQRRNFQELGQWGWKEVGCSLAP